MRQVFDIDAAVGRARDVSASLRKSRAWPYLREQDRTLLELVEKGLSHRLIGQAIGINAGTVSRRLVTLRNRLASPLGKLALDPTTPLPAESRESLLLHAVAGLSLRETARTRRLPLGAVTDQVRYAQGLARGLGARRGV
jgi:DNA-directed RNA polymerase specialized sigma24 family protein